MTIFTFKERTGLTPGTVDWYYRTLFDLLFDGAIKWEDNPPETPAQSTD